jgi:hypothetical protein
VANTTSSGGPQPKTDNGSHAFPDKDNGKPFRSVVFTTKTVLMHVPASLVWFFIRAVQYIVQHGMGLRRDDDDSVLCAYISRLCTFYGIQLTERRKHRAVRDEMARMGRMVVICPPSQMVHQIRG